MYTTMSVIWRLAAVWGLITGATRVTGSQKALGVLDKAYTAEHPSLGVGFDLTATYGMTAVSFPNGTTMTVARVLADDDYVEMFQRLSLESSRHPSPPYKDLGEVWDDEPRQLLRDARKAIGLAPSPDVAYLAKMISDLRARVEEHLSDSIDSASLTTMHLPALYYEDLNDAFEFAGLNFLPYSTLSSYTLYETMAAYAGYGNGLCSNYTDKEACDQEQRSMPEEVVMPILYTRDVLTVSLSIMASAYYLYEPNYRFLVDFSLGYDARPSEKVDEEIYWDAVGMKLQQILIENPYYDRPTKVLLMGDSVRDETFQRVLLKALSHQMTDLPEILCEDSEGVAAKGAAEFAKRGPFSV